MGMQEFERYVNFTAVQMNRTNWDNTHFNLTGLHECKREELEEMLDNFGLEQAARCSVLLA